MTKEKLGDYIFAAQMLAWFVAVACVFIRHGEFPTISVFIIALVLMYIDSEYKKMFTDKEK